MTLRGAGLVLLVAGTLAALGSCSTPAPPPPPPAAVTAPPAPPHAPPPRPRIDYHLTVARDLHTATLAACPQAIPPGRWRAGEDELHPYLLEARAAGPAEAPLGRAENGVTVPADVAGCLVFAIDLDEAADTENSPRAAEWTGPTLVTCPDLWLYRPADFPDDLDARLVIDTPSGLTHSAPFPLDDQGRYVLTRSAFFWLSRVAFGPLRKAAVPVRDRILEVAVLDPERGPSLAVAEVFAAELGRTLTMATGHFPRRRAQMTLEPTFFTTGVLFGRVVRGGSPGAHLIVAAGASARTLADEWVPTHELSHMFLPYMPPRHIWFSEGLATYYQNILRARAGRIPANEAWRNLHEGFVRGADAANGLSLDENARRMRRERNYMRVYWGGTAYFLLADVALRTANPPGSVDEVVRIIGDCCLDEDRGYSVTDLTRAVDQQLGGTRLTDLARALGEDTAPPDLRAAYTALGLVPDGDDLRFSDAGRALRDAITSPPSFGPSPAP